MAQSMNSTVEYTAKASFLKGLTSTGHVMLGNRAFEYYNERNPEDYVQIPWEEVDYVSASVLFGKYIPRFAVFTKKNGNFTFSARDNKALLRAVREHVPEDRLLRSPDFFDILKAGVLAIPKAVKGLFRRS